MVSATLVGSLSIPVDDNFTMPMSCAGMVTVAVRYLRWLRTFLEEGPGSAEFVRATIWLLVQQQDELVFLVISESPVKFLHLLVIEPLNLDIVIPVKPPMGP